MYKKTSRQRITFTALRSHRGRRWRSSMSVLPTRILYAKPHEISYGESPPTAAMTRPGMSSSSRGRRTFYAPQHRNRDQVVRRVESRSAPDARGGTRTSRGGRRTRLRGRPPGVQLGSVGAGRRGVTRAYVVDVTKAVFATGNLKSDSQSQLSTGRWNR